MRHTHSVLAGDADFTGREDVAAVMRLVRDVDPGLPGHPHILIAPFYGGGFFEWDRDTMVIPLTPSKDVDECVVEAVANYRVMIDGLHQDGTLKRAYRQVDQSDFHEAFVRDCLEELVQDEDLSRFIL